MNDVFYIRNKIARWVLKFYNGTCKASTSLLYYFYLVLQLYLREFQMTAYRQRHKYP